MSKYKSQIVEDSTHVEIGVNLVISGSNNVSGPITALSGSSTNWNTAYSWGNHSTTRLFSDLQSKPTTIGGYGITDFNSLWDTQLATKTTDNLTEGANLYSQWDNATGGINYSGGNVGIGTTTPATKLDINGAITATGGNSTNWNAAFTHVSNDGSDHSFINQDVTISATPTFANVISNNNATANNHLVRLDQMNSAIAGLDWQDSILNQLNFAIAEPLTPAEGDRYINNTTGLGSISTAITFNANSIYEWNSGAWVEFVPNKGFTLWDENLNTNYTYNGTAWVEFGSTVSHNNTTGLQGGTSSEYYHLNALDYNGRWQSDGTNVYNTFGNVGIGTITPTTPLDVNGIITATGGNSTNWNTAFTHISNDGSDHSFINQDVTTLGTPSFVSVESISPTNNSDGFTLKFPAGVDATYAGILFKGNDGTFNINYAQIKGGVEAWSPDDGFLAFRTSNNAVLSEKMRITANGNVGIGTTNPLYKLNVVGASGIDIEAKSTDINSEAGFRMSNDAQVWRNYVQGTNDGFTVRDVTHTTNPFQIEPSTPTNTIYVKSTGNVGIGTSSPSEKLHVEGGNFRVTNTDSIVLRSGAGYAGVMTEGTTPLIFYTGGVNERMRIDNTGKITIGNFDFKINTDTFFVDASASNVGIGTITPTTPLDVNGIITATGGNSTNWNTAYSWGDHAGLYLGISAKASDSNLLDGIDSTAFAKLASAQTFTSKQTFTGDVDINSTASTLPQHFYRYMYNATNVYDHYYPNGGNGTNVSTANLRVWNGAGGFKLLNFSGDGSFFWDNNTIFHAGNSNLSTVDWYAKNIVASGTISEGGTLLSSKYLGISAKASDSNLLDGIDSSQFLRSDVNDNFSSLLYGNIQGQSAMGFGFVSNASTPTTLISGAQITGGADFAGLGKINNIDISTWYGFSVSSTFAGTVGQGNPAFSVDARTGNAYLYGSLDTDNGANEVVRYNKSASYSQFIGKGGSTTDWLRTTVNGIIPSTSGGSSSLGTSSWNFNTIYGVTLYENNVSLASKYLGISAKAVDSTNWNGKPRPTNFGNSMSNGSAYEASLDLNTVSIIGESRFFQSSATNKPSTIADGHVWNVAGGDVINRGVQFAYGNNDTGAFSVRSMNGKTWHTIYNAGNSNLSTVDWYAKNIVASGTVTATDFIGTSDERLKTDIKPFKSKKIDTHYKTFRFISDKNKQLRVGVIAQELEKANPEFVRTNSEGIKSVSYIDLHSAEIAQLKEENLELRHKLNLIMNKLEL